MPLGDTLEKLFGGEVETTLETASLELIEAGDNFKSKTILPLKKYELAISFLETLSEDIDLEMEEVTQLHNANRLSYIRQTEPHFNPTKKNFVYEKPSDNIVPILNEAMVLAPNGNGLSRDQFVNVLKWLREEKARLNKPDSISAVQNYLRS